MKKSLLLLPILIAMFNSFAGDYYDYSVFANKNCRVDQENKVIYINSDVQNKLYINSWIELYGTVNTNKAYAKSLIYSWAYNVSEEEHVNINTDDHGDLVSTTPSLKFGTGRKGYFYPTKGAAFTRVWMDARLKDGASESMAASADAHVVVY